MTWYEQLEPIGRDISAIVVFVLLVTGAIVLFGIGFQKLRADRTASASAALSFGFLLLILLTISEFKHVKGFGFDAETWDQQQVEAATLVSQLQGATVATSKELALIASKIGLWDNGPSNDDLMGLILTLNPVLQKAGFDEDKRRELLSPIYQRIDFNFKVQASMDLFLAFKSAYKIPDSESNACRITEDLPASAADFRDRLCNLTKQIYSATEPNVAEFVSLAKSGPLGDDNKMLAGQLQGLAADAEYFKYYHVLRPHDAVPPKAATAQ
jgi:hypothetical protein